VKHNYEISSVSVEPILLAAAKRFLKLDDYTEDDDLVNGLISAAREYCEKHTNRLFVKRQVVEYFDSSFVGLSSQCFTFPTREIDSVEVKQSGIFATVANSVFDIDQIADTTQIFIGPGGSWPDIDSGRNTVKVIYQSGYDVVPASVIVAMKKLISTWYDDRYDGIKKHPSTVQNILHPFLRYT